MNFNKVRAFEFISALSNCQFSVEEFFSTELLELISKYFEMDDVVLNFFDTEGKFLSWITKEGAEAAGPSHPYSKVYDHDYIRDCIYRKSVKENLTYFNLEPKVYRASDYAEAGRDDNDVLIRFLEETFGVRHVLIMAFGINGYIRVCFGKKEAEGDFTREEMENFEDIYRCIAVAYKNFKKYEHARICSYIQDEVIVSGEDAYLITDDFMHILSYNKKAEDRLTEVLGPAVKEQLQSTETCLWLPFLLEGEVQPESAEPVRIKTIRDMQFKIFTYERSYSHGIIDAYHWITISGINEKEEQPAAKLAGSDFSLTSAEDRVAKLLCEGFTYQEIADALMISYHTVKNHVQKIFFKCHINNRYQLFNLFHNTEEEQ